MTNEYKHFFLFALVGTTGFLVDAGILSLLLFAGIGSIPARLPSFLVAATYTWAANRRVTFRDQESSLIKQWAKFLLVNSAGALANLSVYTCLVWPDGGSAVSPAAAVAAGSLAGLIFNFTLSKRFVFINRPAPLYVRTR